MTRFSRIALIGFGEVGQILGAEARNRIAEVSAVELGFCVDLPR